MIKTIELTNFGGYRRLRLDLAPVTVIVGSNAYGKTTLLEAISILMQGIDAAASIVPENASLPTETNVQLLEGLASRYGGWNELLTRNDVSCADHLAIQGTFEGSGRITRGLLTVHVVDGAHPRVAVELEPPVIDDRRSRITSTRRSTSALIRHVNSLRLDEAYLADTEFEAASRTSHHAGLVRNRLVRLNHDAIDRLNRTLRQLAQAEIVSRTSLSEAQAGAALSVHFRREGATFEIRAANHALVSSLALLSEVEAQIAGPMPNDQCVLLMDEPELHLHPLAQAAVAEHIAEISRAVGTQVISVTHSDHIVRRLWGHPESAILNIERQFSRFRRLYSQKDLLKALEKTHDLSPYSAVNFLATRRVLFVEGSTDETILLRCALSHLADSPEGLDRFDAWTRVPLDGVANAPAADLVERLVSSSLLPRLERSEVLVVASVFDRDYDKEPLHQVRSGPQVERIDHVWSRHSIESLFLEVEVLESILCASLGDAAPVDLRDRIRAAIGAADADEGLREGAEDELAEHFRRTRRYAGKEAQVEARRRVRANPETWQRGKDRAAFVLQHLRQSLPLPIQNRVRGSVSKMLEALEPPQLRQVKVPIEIASFLDELVMRARA